VTLLKVFTLVAGFGAASQLASSDYIFFDSFERLVCDGIDCTYCSPSNPVPVCEANSHCTPQTDATSVCSYPAGSGTTGAACTAVADCAGPYACIDTGFGPQCRAWCQVGTSGCSGGQTCVSMAVKVFTGGTEWGVCL